jgi:drug/metabolite transporter (DMT)-like permease
MLAIQAVVVVAAAAALDRLVVPGSPAPGAQVAPTASTALLAAGAFTTVFYLGAFELQRRGGAVLTGQLGSVITVASLALGIAVFDEPPSAITAVALLLVLAGVALVSGGRQSTGEPRVRLIESTSRTP